RPAQSHREVPFDLIVERLGADARDRDGAPLVNITADVLREPTALRLPGTTAEAIDLDLGTAKFGLSFAVEETGTPRCLLQHDRGLLDERTGARLLDLFAELLTTVAAEPSRPLSRLPGARLADLDPAPAPSSGPAAAHPAETCLREHPDVAEATVVELDGRPPLAYAVQRRIGGASSTLLRAHVRARLDAPLVPAAVMILDALPRTADGAPDRSRLPGLPAPAEAAPSGADPSAGGPSAAAPPAAEASSARAPGTEPADGPCGAAVREAFAAVLGQRPGPDDDFFVLGGHSLLAVQLAERLRQSLRLPMTGLDVMEQRTPRALAALLDEREAERGAASAAASARSPRRSGVREGTVLVTGGTGGVGASVLRELAARGVPVRALARPESAHRVAGDGVEVVEGDLLDLDSLRAAASGVHSVIHAACTFTRPEVDLAAMRVLVDSWRRGTFVFVSSVDAYGQPSAADVPEGGPSESPLSPYGKAKLDCERMLLRAAGTEERGGASAVRSPLVWGPHDRLREQLRWGATGALFQAALAGEPIVLPDPHTAAHPWYGVPWVHASALARSVADCVAEPVHGVANAVGGHVAWPEFTAELIRLLGSASEIGYAPEAHRDLDHRWRYRADRLAGPLREQPGEDWRTVLAAMTAPAGAASLAAGQPSA
ncbi:NAD-dependent epimerase/dehydratase family protein, partial [Streptomyces sp. H27-D2]|uniref:NAD-dependent epimerase/dehydratase family protein n=1 Tax=Streptomyces sp. H27-D2 TaxID=3046304 RepID=UPI002DBCAF94